MPPSIVQRELARAAHHPPVSIGRQFFVLAVSWSILTLLAMGFDMWNTWQKSLEAGRLQARAALEKDIGYRQWHAKIGKIYGTIGEYLQPNPYLNTTDRDVVTTTGVKLTLITPDLMIRQVHELAEKNSVLSGHITSLRPIRPENAPDDWEKAALEGFEHGEKEISSHEEVDQQEYMRMMRPLPVDDSCLSCHGQRDHKKGDVWGGISVRISMQEMRSLYTRHIFTVYLLYAAVWLVGLIGLGFGAWRLKSQIDQKIGVERALQDFKLSLDNINDSVLMFDTDNLNIFYSNQGAWNLTGFTENEILMKGLPDLICHNGLPSFYAILGPLYRREKESFTFETECIHHDGHPVPVEIHIAYVVPRAGADRFLAVIRDISERKAAEKEKEVMQAQLLQAQKLESVGQLAAGIAHEINTPLQFISTNVEFLRDAYRDIFHLLDITRKISDSTLSGQEADGGVQQLAEILADTDLDFLCEEIPPAIDQSLDGLQRVSSLVLAMKNFSHPGNREIHPEDLNSIVETTILISKNEWKSVADLKMQLAPDLPQVPCLRNEIGQVLLNLIINAAHALADCKKGGESEPEKGTITVATAIVGRYAEITVADTGAGIPVEIRNRIFDPFFTTKEVGKGSGQGLAICRDVIERKHKGFLTFSSEYGRGTTFSISLPLVPDQTS
jgi:PAS domain S-box-containing protein